MTEYPAVGLSKDRKDGLFGSWDFVYLTCGYAFVASLQLGSLLAYLVLAADALLAKISVLFSIEEFGCDHC